ncbi:MAG: HEAT repeat domain-containing protein [Planctomycetota bacterium]
MSANSPLRAYLSLVLQVITVGLLITLLLRRSGPSSTNPLAGLEEVREELSQARYQLGDQANRLTRLLDRLAREGLSAGSGNGAIAEPDVRKTPTELLEELANVTEVLSRWKSDPLQREPVEKERARLEDLLRRYGNDTIDALGGFFPTIVNLMPEAAGPTWMQTRLLTHVVAQIDTDEAVEYARYIFEDQTINSGVRLKAAEIAMKKYEDQIILRLIDLLVHPDPNFSRPNQIVLFFKQKPDARAIPALIQVATDQEAERGVRRFTLDTLGTYDDHRVIDALKEVAVDPANVDLRGVAVNSLNKLLGKDILDFVEYLKGQIQANDPLLNLLLSIEQMYQE